MGPTEDKRRLVAGIITSLLNNQPIQVTEGEQIRDFLHVEDVAAAIVAVMNSSLNGIVNIGSGQPISVKHIATYLGQLLGRFDLVQLGALPYRKGDPMFVCANPKLLKSQTNWNPSYTIEAGLEQTVKWYAQN